MNRLIKPGELYDSYRETMRAACPVPPEGIIAKFMMVNIAAGEGVAVHAHKRHAVLFYPEAAEKMVITPEPGTMIYLPPGTSHYVPKVKAARFSLAMLIENKP